MPIASGSLQGFDSLLSTVMMPPGMPVATVAVGGAENAGLLAAQIIALGDAGLPSGSQAEREARRAKVLESDAEVRKRSERARLSRRPGRPALCGVSGAGQIVAFPTETYYGLAVDALDEAALERLWALKQRPADKVVALIVADRAMAGRCVAEIPPRPPSR